MIHAKGIFSLTGNDTINHFRIISKKEWIFIVGYGIFYLNKCMQEIINARWNISEKRYGD